jgi:4-amino-4-deoxy-L-arabinose transferase-like glycosyltransferase
VPSAQIQMTSLDDSASLSLTDASAAPAARLASAGARTARLVRAIPWPICLIVAVAAWLRFAELEDVTPNLFYDAAVRSMSMSWHNFFFGAFDPSAFLSVDKAPLDLWLQVASVKAFGWNAAALKLPEALGGTLAVPLLYDTVRRVAGRPAALASATVLAVLPESVLTSRSDTMDSVMMLLVIASLWLMIRAAGTGHRRHALLAGVALGLAFNVKLFEALIAAPALVIVYALGARVSWRRRVADLLLAGAGLVVVGLSWAVAASIAPGPHPWPVGSTDGSVWNVMFVFNGFGRVSSPPPNGRPGGPGLFRLFQSNSWQFDTLFGCALIAAIAVGLTAALVALARRRRSLAHTAGRPRLETPPMVVAFCVAVAVWLTVSYALFSHQATVHTRYLEAAAPALAAAVGIGAAALAGLTGWRRQASRPSVTGVAIALGGVAAYTFHLRPASIATGAVSVTIAAVGATLIARTGGRIGLVARWLTLFLVVATTVLYPIHQSYLVVTTRASNSHGLLTYAPGYERNLWTYLAPRTAGTRYELVVDEPLALAPLIIHEQRPIIPLTSFKGIRAVGLDQVRSAVAAGQVRYALIGAHACSPGFDRNPACVPAAQWIRRSGIDISAAAGVHGGHRLYELLPQ